MAVQAPTFPGIELELRSKMIGIKGRKDISEITLTTNREVTVKEKAFAV